MVGSGLGVRGRRRRDVRGQNSGGWGRGWRSGLIGRRGCDADHIEQRLAAAAEARGRLDHQVLVGHLHDIGDGRGLAEHWRRHRLVPWTTTDAAVARPDTRPEFLRLEGMVLPELACRMDTGGRHAKGHDVGSIWDVDRPVAVPPSAPLLKERGVRGAGDGVSGDVWREVAHVHLQPGPGYAGRKVVPSLAV